MKEKILIFWRDPVWSKVISAIIIGVGIILYNSIVSLFSGVEFQAVISNFFQTEIKIWILAASLILFFILTAIFNYYKKDRPIAYSYDDKSLALDIALFNRIRNELLSVDTIRWVRTNNFAGFSFNEKYLEPFDNIEFHSDEADFEFLNPNLDRLKSELIDSINDFNSFLLPNIFAEGNNRLGVPAEWELTQYDRFIEAVNGIHSRAHDVAAKYDDFIKQGRKILKV